MHIVSSSPLLNQVQVHICKADLEQKKCASYQGCISLVSLQNMKLHVFTFKMHVPK